MEVKRCQQFQNSPSGPPYYETVFYERDLAGPIRIRARVPAPSAAHAQQELRRMAHLRYHGAAIRWTGPRTHDLVEIRPPADPDILGATLERLWQEMYAMLRSHELPGSRPDLLTRSSKELQRQMRKWIIGAEMTTYEALFNYNPDQIRLPSPLSETSPVVQQHS